MRTSAEIRQKRVALIEMMLSLHSLITRRDVPVEETLVMFAIRLGQYQGKPMDVKAITTCTTFPRTSILRHLVVLRAKGHIRTVKTGRRALQFLPLEPERAEVTAFYNGVEKVVRRAFADMSKMDPFPLDTKRFKP